MAVTIINQDDIPAGIAPGTYCCRLDESSSLMNGAGFRARLIIPLRVHKPGDCLIQLIKHETAPVPGDDTSKEG